jgi:hypothetical protein
VGDNPPGPGNPAQHPLNSELLERFHASFGPDFWTIAVAGGFVIGLNAQLFGTNHSVGDRSVALVRRARSGGWYATGSIDAA